MMRLGLWVMLFGATACMLTVDLPSPTEGNAGGAGPDDEAQGGGGEGGGGESEGGEGGSDEGDGGAAPVAGTCGPVALGTTTTCDGCDDRCCSERDACDASLDCLCWMSCLYDGGSDVPASLCATICSPEPAALTKLAACLAEDCPRCAPAL